MRVSQREQVAIVTFLMDLKHARGAGRRLRERADEEPDKVLAYLDSLPSGVGAGDRLLRKRERRARRAIGERM